MSFPSLPHISDAQYRSIISASADRKIAIGLVELFGGLKFRVILTDCWDGPDLQKGRVNPRLYRRRLNKLEFESTA